MKSNYKAVDKTLSTSSKIKETMLKELKEGDGLEEVIHLYNDVIAKEYNLEKTKEAKTAIRNILLFLSFNLIGNLAKQYKYEEKAVEKLLIGKEFKKSINRAVNYATQNKNLVLYETIQRPLAKIDASLVIRRMSQRANTLIDTAGVEASNLLLLEKAKERGYTEFTFEAVVDDRTTDLCLNMNGRTFPIDLYAPGENVPPLHIHCRSAITFH